MIYDTSVRHRIEDTNKVEGTYHNKPQATSHKHTLHVPINTMKTPLLSRKHITATRGITCIALALLLLLPSCSSAFHPVPVVPMSKWRSLSTDTTVRGPRMPSSSSRSLVVLKATPPILERWVFLENGSVQGFVKNHPTFDDGDEITTSTLMPNVDLTNGGLVKTRNGSQYKLGTPARGQKEVFRSKKALAAKISANTGGSKSPSMAVLEDLGKIFSGSFSNSSSSSSESAPVSGSGKTSETSVNGSSGMFSFMNGSSKSIDEKASTPAPVPVPTVPRVAEIKRPALNGRSVGNGKYVLAGKAVTSSLKSLIFAGYRTDSGGNPIGEMLTVKLSTNYEALERENRNYNRAATGIFPGAFVNKIEFLTYADGKGFDDYSALIIEAGRTDLRALLNDRDGSGLEGRALRDAAAAAGLCIQAMHSSGLVWTDLKAENFVVVSDSMGDDNLPGVKGIDLESAMPMGQNPVDYSPEACPPEFAKSFMAGDAAEFRLDPSYDIWSLGMLLYEISTGTAYFAGQSPSAVTKILSNDSFQADVSAVDDPKLRNLIAKCLQTDPRKRPNITSFLLHPYFTTTGLFAWSF